MKRKRKPTIKRVRRSPYERSLEYATARLEKAIAEENDCQQRLAALHKEIPYLQTVIRALTPVTERLDKEVYPKEVGVNAIPDHLKKFTTVSGNYPPPIVNITAPADISQEDFLSDAMAGKELLP